LKNSEFWGKISRPRGGWPYPSNKKNEPNLKFLISISTDIQYKKLKWKTYLILKDLLLIYMVWSVGGINKIFNIQWIFYTHFWSQIAKKKCPKLLFTHTQVRITELSILLQAGKFGWVGGEDGKKLSEGIHAARYEVHNRQPIAEILQKGNINSIFKRFFDQLIIYLFCKMKYVYKANCQTSISTGSSCEKIERLRDYKNELSDVRKFFKLSVKNVIT